MIVARGALELLWEPCYESGDDYLGTARDIETLVGWTGEVGALALALVECGAPEGHGFIEIVKDHGDERTTYKVHDLWHHAPEYVSVRHAREQERQKAKRCRRCKTIFHSADSRSLYCSKACRQGGYRERDGHVRNAVSSVTDRDGTPAPAHAPAPAPALAPALAPAPVEIAPASRVVPLPARGSLTGKHHVHDPDTWAACERGLCVPPFVVSEWRTQSQHAGKDADAEVRQTVTDGLARAPSQVGDTVKFWRGVWASRHGTPSVDGGKGAAVVQGVQRGLARYAERKAREGA